MNEAKLLEFVRPYYANKDIMHNMWHIELVRKLDFMEKNVLDKSNCYLPETIPLCEEMNEYTNSFFEEIVKEIR
ncbi:MAG: hypothetical protein IKJ88_05670 [Clostridia bacterium]|nr:hypothetical protein [Clostridia bacterium]